MIGVVTDPAVSFWLLMCGLCVVASALFSGAETGLYCMDRLRLRLAAHERNPSAQRLLSLLDDQAGLLFSMLVGTNVANYLASGCMTLVMLHVLLQRHVQGSIEAQAELYTTLLLTPILFIFGEVVPKNVFQRRADSVMLRTAWLPAAAYWLARLSGVLAVQKWLSRSLLRRLGPQRPPPHALHPRLEMYQMLREEAEHGAISATQAVMLERIHSLQAVRAEAVMVPVSRAIMLRADDTLEAARRNIGPATPSRLPVYAAERRRPVGVVHFLDVLTGPAESRVSNYLLPPIELAPDLPVIDALSVLQQQHRRMAFVTDREGRCLGIVTVKDLVEEIVGELAAW